MEESNKIIISLPGQKQLEEADHDRLTQDELAKLKNILTAIEAAEGIGLPYGTCKRVSVVYAEIKEYLAEQEG